jgi:hypothetical protein
MALCGISHTSYSGTHGIGQATSLQAGNATSSFHSNPRASGARGGELTIINDAGTQRVLLQGPGTVTPKPLPK